MVDSDCVRAPVRLSCREDCPVTDAFSQAGAAELEAAVAEIEAKECSEFETLGCSASAPMCDSSPPEFKCVQNVCTTRIPPNTIPDCVLCLENTLQWTWHSGPGIDDGSRVEPCATYMRHRSNAMTGEEASCETELVACNAFTSTGAIRTALSHHDVQDALRSSQSPASFGNTRSGDVLTITIGMQQIEVGGSCEGAPPNCIPAPEGVQALRDLLQQIDQALSGPMGQCPGFD
jgi:hypothetical protein